MWKVHLSHHLSLLSRNTLWSLIFVMYVLPCCTWLLSVFLSFCPFYRKQSIREKQFYSTVTIIHVQEIHWSFTVVTHRFQLWFQRWFQLWFQRWFQRWFQHLFLGWFALQSGAAPMWSESRSPPPGASCYIQDFHSWFLGFFYASREHLSVALRTTADKSYHKMRRFVLNV